MILLVLVAYLVAAGSALDSSLDPVALLENGLFRYNVHALHVLFFAGDGDPGLPHFNSNVVENAMKQFRQRTNYDSLDKSLLKNIDVVTSDIEKLETEIRLLSQNLNILEDSQGDQALTLQQIRADSSEADLKMLSRLRYTERPRPEQIEELSQSLARNQAIIKKNERELKLLGVGPEKLRQLRDQASPDSSSEFSLSDSDSGSETEPSRRRLQRPLSWRSSRSSKNGDQNQDEMIRTRRMQRPLSWRSSHLSETGDLSQDEEELEPVDRPASARLNIWKDWPWKSETASNAPFSP